MRTALTTLEKMELAKKITELNDMDFMEVIFTAYKIHETPENERDNVTPLTADDIAYTDVNELKDELAFMLEEIRSNLYSTVYEVDFYNTEITMSEDEYTALCDDPEAFVKIRDMIEKARDAMTGGTEPNWASASVDYDDMRRLYYLCADDLSTYRTIKNGVVSLWIEHVELNHYYEDRIDSTVYQPKNRTLKSAHGGI